MRRKLTVLALTVAAFGLLAAGWLLPSGQPATADQPTTDIAQPRLSKVEVAVPEQYRASYDGPSAINLPPGFSISLYASLPVSSARGLALGACGDIFVGSNGSVNRPAKVYRLPDRNHDGTADSVNVFVDAGYSIQHGVEYWNGRYYVGSETDIVQYDQPTCDSLATNPFALISGLPTGGSHVTRTPLHADDGSLYISVGSSCNSCVETDNRRATVLKYDPQLRQTIFAGGLRNSVGLAFRPGTTDIWATDNAHEDEALGDDRPSDEINIVRQGKSYGWPYCYDLGTPVTTWPAPKPNYCRDFVQRPAIKLGGHVAPMMLTFSENSNLSYPVFWKQGIFVAERGSRYPLSTGTVSGYKLVYIPAFAPHSGWPNQPPPILDFATDPAHDRLRSWRPVGLVIGSDGALYLSVDTQAQTQYQGAVYRIWYSGLATDRPAAK